MAFLARSDRRVLALAGIGKQGQKSAVRGRQIRVTIGTGSGERGSVGYLVEG